MDKSCDNCSNYDFPCGINNCGEGYPHWKPKPGTWISEKLAEASGVKIPTKLMNTTDEIFMPSRKYPNDAGADLRARIEGTFAIYPGEICKIPTGVAVEIPERHVGMIQPRSGASSEGKVAITGTIDRGYTGELSINLINLSRCAVTINPGERLAQLIVIPCLIAEFEQVEELGESERGPNGFGSSGKM